MTRNSHSAGSSIASVIGILFVVYMLSPGPVVRMLYGPGGYGRVVPSPAMDRPVGIVYAPIEFIADYVPFVSEFYLWYFQLWGIE